MLPFTVLLGGLGVQVCMHFNWFKLLGCVLVPWSCYNKVPQTEQLKQQSIRSRSWRQMSQINCGQGRTPSAGARAGSVQASPRPLVVSGLWQQNYSLPMVFPRGLFSVSTSPLLIRTPVIRIGPSYPQHDLT